MFFFGVGVVALFSPIFLGDGWVVEHHRDTGCVSSIKEEKTIGFLFGCICFLALLVFLRDTCLRNLVKIPVFV